MTPTDQIKAFLDECEITVHPNHANQNEVDKLIALCRELVEALEMISCEATQLGFDEKVDQKEAIRGLTRAAKLVSGETKGEK